jgi:hypothetical protein
MPKGCQHANRKKIGDRRFYCEDCRREFTPRGLPVRHGTVEGYNCHIRKRSGQWGWPACPKCSQAKLEWRREYDSRPESVRSRKVRTAARAAALERLRRQYPGAYSAAYREELEARGGEVVRQQYEVPVWEDIITRLVMAVTGLPEAEAEERSHPPYRSTLEEREVMSQVHRLRVLLAARYEKL